MHDSLVHDSLVHYIRLHDSLVHYIRLHYIVVHHIPYPPVPWQAVLGGVTRLALSCPEGLSHFLDLEKD